MFDELRRRIRHSYNAWLDDQNPDRGELSGAFHHFLGNIRTVKTLISDPAGYVRAEREAEGWTPKNTRSPSSSAPEPEREVQMEPEPAESRSFLPESLSPSAILGKALLRTFLRNIEIPADELGPGENRKLTKDEINEQVDKIRAILTGPDIEPSSRSVQSPAAIATKSNRLVRS